MGNPCNDPVRPPIIQAPYSGARASSRQRGSSATKNRIFLFVSALLLSSLSRRRVVLCQTSSDSPYSEVETDDLLRQIDFSLRAGVQPLTVVAPIPGIIDGFGGGRGVVYAGDDPLPPGTTVGLYRALLVRKDLWLDWIDNGTIDTETWEKFWKYYSVEFTGEIGPEGSEREETEGDNDMPWMALPVGDVGGGPDDPTWWKYGLLSDQSLGLAIKAVNAKTLVDWRRLAASKDGKSFLLFNAHILNEPSAPVIGADGEVQGGEAENISHLAGSGCPSTQGKTVRVCGTAFEAKTSRAVYTGEQLVWCYGEGYARTYPVASICLDDSIREGGSRKNDEL